MSDVKVDLVTEIRHKTNQGYLLDRIIKVHRSKPPVQRLRIEVYRDSYDQQSYARISLWSGTEWNVVASLRGTEPEVAAGPSYVVFSRSRGTCEDWQDRIADRLLTTATAVVL